MRRAGVDVSLVSGVPSEVPVPERAAGVSPRGASGPGRLRLLPGVCTPEGAAVLRDEPLRHPEGAAVRIRRRRPQEDGHLCR